MEQGLITERQGKIFPYQFYQGALYGFNNFYGATCRVARGGTDPTSVGDDPKTEIIELNIVGLTVKPEDLRSMYDNMVPYLYDKISEEEYEIVLKKIAEERPEPDMAGIEPIKKLNRDKNIFECLNREEVIKILRDLRDLPERAARNKPKRKIEGIIHVDKRSQYYTE